MSFDTDFFIDFIEDTIRKKINERSPHLEHKPFADRLLGRDKMASYSITHSLLTTIGMTLYEQIGEVIARNNFEFVQRQFVLEQTVTKEAQEVITQVINGINTGTINADNSSELEKIRQVCQSGNLVDTKLTRVDLLLINDDSYFPIDFKTPKPNIAGVESQKRIILNWMASILGEFPRAHVRPIIGFPYNPSFPDEYNHFTLGNTIDTSENGQLLIGDDLWNFLAGGEDIYEDLLFCFEVAGNNLRYELEKFVQQCLIANVTG